MKESEAHPFTIKFDDFDLMDSIVALSLSLSLFVDVELILILFLFFSHLLTLLFVIIIPISYLLCNQFISFAEKKTSIEIALHPNPIEDCPNGSTTFELITGHVFTSPSDTVIMIPGVLHLAECLDHCRQNQTCSSLNFETGLCVLLSSSARQLPQALTPSQFPVFTIYAEKICLKGKTLNEDDDDEDYYYY